MTYICEHNRNFEWCGRCHQRLEAKLKAMERENPWLGFLADEADRLWRLILTRRAHANGAGVYKAPTPN